MICDQDLNKLLEDYESNEHIVSAIEHWLQTGLGLNPKTAPRTCQIPNIPRFSLAVPFKQDSCTNQANRCMNSWRQANTVDETVSSIPMSRSGMSISPVQRRFQTMSPVRNPRRRSCASIGSASRRSSSSDFNPFRETYGLDPKRESHHEPGPVHFYRPTCVGWSPHPHKFMDTTIGSIYPKDVASVSKPCRQTSGLDPKRESHCEPGPVHFYRPTCVGWSPYPHKFVDATIGSIYPPKEVASSVRSLSRSSGRNTPRAGFRETKGLDPKRDSEFEPGPTHFYRESCMERIS